MNYIDRKNPPPTWGEVKKLEREEGRKEVAKRMIKEGISLEVIVKLTELEVEEIQKLTVE